MSHLRFWCDDLDMDLPKVLPDLDSILGDTANIRLWVHGRTKYGRLHHPDISDGDASFGLTPDGTGEWYRGGAPLVECTWREAVRDAWPSAYRLHISGVEVWDTLRHHVDYADLEDDARGQYPLPARERTRILADVRGGLVRACSIVRELVAAEAAIR